jgi:RHS repeat-associated protein
MARLARAVFPGLPHQVAGAATTRFAYDGVNAIAEYDGSNALQRRFVFGPGIDQPIVQYEGSGTADRRFMSTDERGSIISATDSSGTLLNINRYDEYGTPQSTNAGRFQYTGQAWLPELGMQYSKARIYSPTLGRFLQTDPSGTDGGINLYAYTGNDSINFLDPSGNGRIEGSICGVGDPCTINGIDHDVLFTELERDAAQRVANIQEALATCGTPQPAYECGLFRDQSPQALTTLKELLGNADIRQAIVWALVHSGFYTGSNKNENGFWAAFENGDWSVVSLRPGSDHYTPFYPIPSGATVFFHIHPFTIAEGGIPGFSMPMGMFPGDLGLGARNSVFMLLYNAEFRQFYWQDYRR